ncbi:MAG TPA: CHAD domain-containing protein [Burkholderiales bacterium]|nr:CHAD domain-containing protein [Burkholderiales bacterium]
MHIERELKFRLAADPGTRLWALLPGDPVPNRRRLDSTYFDTPDFRLREARSALRLRRDGRRRIMCFKSEAPGSLGVPQRREWEAPALRGGLAPDALPCAEIKAAAGVDLRRHAAALGPLFQTRFVRRSAQVVLGDGTRVEVCLDSGTIAAGRHSGPLLELELELIEGSAASMLALAESLVEPLGLELEVRSKAEQGYRLAERRAATPLKAQAPRLRRAMSAERAMLEILDSCRAQVQANVHGAMNSRNPEFLHQLRVGLRRLRSALRIFSPLASKGGVRPVARELQSVVAQLGGARDWDVFHSILSQQIAPPAGRSPEMARLLRMAGARRSAARGQAREALAATGFQSFLLHLMRWTEQAPWRRSAELRRALAQPAGQFGRRALARQERKALRHAQRIDWADPAARHRLRILVKRLRYACEFFSDALPAKTTRRYLERLEAVQDVLGELNDVAVGARLLRELDKGASPACVGFVQGWFAARQAQLIAQLGAVWRAWKKQARFGRGA